MGTGLGGLEQFKIMAQQCKGLQRLAKFVNAGVRNVGLGTHSRKTGITEKVEHKISR